jgi:hypothetical protein
MFLFSFIQRSSQKGPSSNFWWGFGKAQNLFLNPWGKTHSLPYHQMLVYMVFLTITCMDVFHLTISLCNFQDLNLYVTNKRKRNEHYKYSWFRPRGLFQDIAKRCPNFYHRIVIVKWLFGCICFNAFIVQDWILPQAVLGGLWDVAFFDISL